MDYETLLYVAQRRVAEGYPISVPYLQRKYKVTYEIAKKIVDEAKNR